MESLVGFNVRSTLRVGRATEALVKDTSVLQRGFDVNAPEVIIRV